MIDEDTLRTFLHSNGIELLKSHVAEGGSARLHKARVVDAATGFPLNGSLIAVKEFRGRIVSQQSQRDRIQVESTLGKDIDHPNFVKTYGLIGSPDGEDDPYLLAMEWLDGSTLEDFIENHPEIEWHLRRSFALSIIDAVEHLHSKRIFHRDLKAENIFVLPDNAIKVMDLGISLPFDDETRTRHTAVKEFIGSARFASPQFIAGEEFKSSDDVYALGTVLFHLLTGVSVYTDVVRKPMILVRVMNAPPEIKSWIPDVPEGLRYAIDGCLHHNPAVRPTLAELKEAIERPTDAPYIAKEKSRRARVVRGSPVIASMGAEDVYIRVLESAYVGATLNIVREIQLSEKVYTESWVATVRVMHVSDDIAHCIILKQKWIESQAINSLARMISRAGHFAYTDPEPGRVRVGDRAVEQ